MGDLCKLISIDSSTKCTGIAVFENGIYKKHYLVDFSDINGIENRFPVMCSKVIEILELEKPDIICIEDMKQPRNVLGFKHLCKLLGIVHYYAIKNNVDYHEIAPSVWRKNANTEHEKLGRKREELKKWSMEKVKKMYGLDVVDDVADAILIGQSYINQFIE